MSGKRPVNVSQHPPPLMKPPAILIIDDEPNNFDVIETLLGDQDYQLYYAASGQEALASLASYNPDLILLDVMMPNLDGIEVCRQIKAMPQWQPVPIIMVTALTAKQDLAYCLQSGADDFISKPINRLELEARVQSMLRIKQQYDQLQSFAQRQRHTINLLSSSLEGLRGNLTTALPHELRTPLTGVLGGLNFVLSGLDTMELAEIREFLELSQQSARQLEKLTQRFLNYLSLDLLQSAPYPEDSSDTILIQYLAHQLAQQWERFPDLTYQVADGDLAIAAHHLQWIVEEVIDNAFKFSAPGTAVVIQGQPQGRHFHLQICDRGHGLTPEQIASIGPFMQFERERYEQQGLGLGLAIAHQAIQLYGGNLTVTSRYGQSTTIALTFPLSPG